MKYKYIFLNKLYATNKALAISKIKEQVYDIPLMLQYLNKNFLKDLNIWNDNISKQLILFNTQNYFTNYRIQDIRYRLLNFICPYLPSYQADSYLLLDYYMYFNSNFYNIDLVPFIKLNIKGRYITLDFMKLIKDQSKELFYFLIQNNNELFRFIINNDKTLLDDEAFLKELLGTNKTDLAILSLPYSKWHTVRHFITDEFIKENIFKFKLADLFAAKSCNFIWDILKEYSYGFRYKMYTDLEPNKKILQFVRQDLKNLVQSNCNNLINKYKQCTPDILSIITEMIDQIVVYPILIGLIYQVIAGLEDLAKDICIFYILKYISNKKACTTNNSFCRWYINITKLIKLLYKGIDSAALVDFIDVNLHYKRYSIILLLEITRHKINTFDINEIFLYEDYGIKLKEEIFERYQLLLNTNIMNIEYTCDIKYMTSIEIKKYKFTGFNFKYIEDYLYIRNVAKVVSYNLDRIDNLQVVKDFFVNCSKSQEEDIKLIGNSMLSKLQIHCKNVHK